MCFVFRFAFSGASFGTQCSRLPCQARLFIIAVPDQRPYSFLPSFILLQLTVVVSHGFICVIYRTTRSLHKAGQCLSCRFCLYLSPSDGLYSHSLGVCVLYRGP